MIIRNFELRDLDEVIRMENENFPDPWPRESFLYDKDNEVASFKVLEKDDKVIGYYILYYMFENADIGNICIDTEYQGNGLGEYLFKDLLINCIKNEIEFVHLEVRVDNEKAYNLYSKMGFEKTRIRKGYYNGVDAIEMVKGLIGLNEEDFSN